MSFLRKVEFEHGFGPATVMQADLGFIPNLYRAQSLLPRIIEAQLGLENAVRREEGAISKVQKIRILLGVAAVRQDAYCVAFERNALSSLGVTDSKIDALLADYHLADLGAADVMLLDFCLKLSRHPPSIRSDDIEQIRAQGFGDESIVEAVLTTAWAVFRCTLSVALGPEPDFPSRKPPLTAFAPTNTTVLQNSPRRVGHATHKEGPYVCAPYLSPSAFAPFDRVQKTHGFIPNFFRAQTLRPGLLAAEIETVTSILLPEDLLTRLQKECILLAVSATNLNSYCVAVHCNLLRGLGMSPEEGDQIAVDHHESVLPENDRALLDFAIKLGPRFCEFSRRDVDRLRTHGFTDEQILESVAVTALNNFANTLQIGLGVEPEFEPAVVFPQNKVHLSMPAAPPIAGAAVAQALATTLEDPDAELVAAAQSGSLEAFEKLVRLHSRMIYRALVAILGNAEDAQDAMQDALLSAFKNLAGFQRRSKFSTWLVTIARNAALQRLRSRKDDVSLDEDPSAGDQEYRPRQVQAWQDNPEQQYSHVEIQQIVERGIMRLAVKYRTVVMMRDIQELSTDEVARQLGLSVPAVKVRLLRGRLMLREWLSPYFAPAAGRLPQ